MKKHVSHICTGLHSYKFVLSNAS